MDMPRALKGLLQFVIGLALMFAFMYPRMAPIIRRSRAMKRAAAQPPRSTKPGDSPAAMDLDRILSFTSDVTLHANATLEVREEFVVHNVADAFRYGMVRDLPIDSEARWDQRLVGPYAKDTGIRVKILEVTEDGAPISCEQGSDASYEQLRIGEPLVPLALGDHRFVVRYEADGVMQFLSDHDQLYWNAVGHYWRVPVDVAVVRLHLPAELPANVVAADAYAGHRGATPEHGAVAPIERTAIPDGFEFRVANLPASQSPSVWLTWPKGFLAPPALGPLSHDATLLIAPALLLLYYLVVWLALGREPQPGVIATQYQAPQGLSPAAVRYIRTTGCDGRTFAATLAQLAARGCIAIEPQPDGRYRLTRLSAADPATLHPPLANEEAQVFAVLFETGPTATLDPKNGNELNRYVNYINLEMQKASGNLYFTRNARWLVLGTFASFLAAMGMALTAHGRAGDRMTLVFLTWWFFFCFFFLGLIAVMALLPAWSRMLRGLGGAKPVLIGSAAVSVFGVAGVAVLWQLKSGVSLAYALSLLALVAINIAAFPALRRTTPRGRQVLDQIEGFRQFLQKVEQDRMRRVAVDDPHAASEFLPYAIALELREPWGDHLAEACVATTTTR